MKNLKPETKIMLAAKIVGHLYGALTDDFNFGEAMQGSIREADNQPDVAASFVASINRHEAAGELAAKMLGYEGRAEAHRVINMAKDYQLDPIPVLAARLPQKIKTG